MNENLIEFRGISKRYGGTKYAVENLDLQVRKGEFLTLLGASGSGKTTTLMMLAGFQDPSEGELLISGKPLTSIPVHKRNFGMVFQNYALFPNMSVFENILFPLVERKVPRAKREQMAKAIVSLVHLDGFEKRRPYELSGGQQQRVALARALIHDPVLVLMDEPLGALDKNLREQMHVELKQIHERLNNTMVFVTHDQSEALTLSDRIAVFDNGRIRQISPPDELYNRPVDSYVANFVGENNILSGKLERSSGETCVVRLDGGEIVEATSGFKGSPGDRAVVCVRPERLEIVADPAETNCLSGTIDEIIFLGDQQKMFVNLSGGRKILIKDANKGRSQTLAKGQAVTVAAAASSCWAIRD